MATAASAFVNPIAAELEGAGPKPTAQALSRRARQRRQIQVLIGGSYILDATLITKENAKSFYFPDSPF